MEKKGFHTAVRLDQQSRQNLDELAARLERSRSGVIRLLLSRAAELLIDQNKVKESLKNG